MSHGSIIERWIVDELGKGMRRSSMGHDEDLLELGLLDSVAVVRLVNYLEQQFGIEVLDEDLVPESFRTIDAIAALVASRAAPRDAAE